MTQRFTAFHGAGRTHNPSVEGSIPSGPTSNTRVFRTWQAPDRGLRGARGHRLVALSDPSRASAPRVWSANSSAWGRPVRDCQTMQDGSERPLAGGWQTDVRRSGDVVLRSPKLQSRTVIALLQHLESVGFDAAPRPVDSGFAPDGREQLSYIEGESPHPHAWSDNAAWRLGGLLSRLHAATTKFVAPPEHVWRPWFARSLPGAHPVIGHGDLGAWNVLASRRRTGGAHRLGQRRTS